MDYNGAGFKPQTFQSLDNIMFCCIFLSKHINKLLLFLCQMFSNSKSALTLHRSSIWSGFKQASLTECLFAPSSIYGLCKNSLLCLGYIKSCEYNTLCLLLNICIHLSTLVFTSVINWTGLSPETSTCRGPMGLAGLVQQCWATWKPSWTTSQVPATHCGNPEQLRYRLKHPQCKKALDHRSLLPATIRLYKCTNHRTVPLVAIKNFLFLLEK